VGASTSHNPMGLHGLLQGYRYLYILQLLLRKYQIFLSTEVIAITSLKCVLADWFSTCSNYSGYNNRREEANLLPPSSGKSKLDKITLNMEAGDFSKMLEMFCQTTLHQI
jgi:hypothetical protein